MHKYRINWKITQIPRARDFILVRLKSNNHSIYIVHLSNTCEKSNTKYLIELALWIKITIFRDFIDARDLKNF
jgi:hypothetical protein